MQFLAPTWRQFSVDGDHDGNRDVYDPDDAIPAAARYLKHEGAPEQLKKALFAYNHSLDYIRIVLNWATTYAHSKYTITTANCAGTTAPAPKGSPAKIIAYARAQLGKPYVWGAEGPDSFDCSGLTLRAYQTVGVQIPRVTYDQWRSGPRIANSKEQPGDLVFMRMETAGPGHVGIVTGNGRMIHAPNRHTVVQESSYKTRNDVTGFIRPTNK